jgi:hypothetical protein
MTFTRALSTNNYGPAKFIVDGTTTANGTHSTIAAALTSASSGDTIFIRPGTYTENLTLKAGVNLTAFGCDSSLNGTGNVKIVGKATLSTAGTVTISGIELKTSSDFFLVVSGANASIVNLNNCHLNCLNATGISFTASNTAAQINIAYCWGNLGTTGIGLFSGSSTGLLRIFASQMRNSGLSTTASTMSAGSYNIENSSFTIPLSTTSTAAMAITNCVVDCAVVNATALLYNGSVAGNAEFTYFASGSSSAVSVGSGATLAIDNCTISSSNTNAMTGAGTVNMRGCIFSNSSVKSNVTTQTGGAATGLTQGTAPSAGCIGEQLIASASSVATTSTTAKTITSISLTPGIWDISASSLSTATGGTALMQAVQCGISTTNNTLPAGVSEVYQLTVTGTALGAIAPIIRATLSATTTYYYVVTNFYSSTTCPTTGRITATRVG